MRGLSSVTIAMVILLIVGGLLAAASLIAKKNEQAGEAIKKIAPYQSFIGLGLAIVGLLNLISLIMNLTAVRFLLAFVPVSGIIFIVSVVLSVALGIVLAMNFLKTKKNIPQEKLEALEKKLTPLQIPMGVAGIAVGLYLVLWKFIGWGF